LGGNIGGAIGTSVAIRLVPEASGNL